MKFCMKNWFKWLMVCIVIATSFLWYLISIHLAYNRGYIDGIEQHICRLQISPVEPLLLPSDSGTVEMDTLALTTKELF